MSCIVTGTPGTDPRLIVAGGAGGHGDYDRFPGGSAGVPSPGAPGTGLGGATEPGGKGGTLTAGGAGGTGDNGNGTAGLPGSGGKGFGDSDRLGGGGGGGGFFGGGGGGGGVDTAFVGGGGGGSSYVIDSATSAQFSLASGPAQITITYVEDSTAPATPAVTGSTPVSPENDNAPRIKGTAEAGSTVRLYTNAACVGAVAGSGTAAAFASPGLAVSVTNDSSTTYYATATDAAGNASDCSPGRDVHRGLDRSRGAGRDRQFPVSPANDNAPLLKGTAEAGSTVRVYTNATCSGPVAVGHGGGVRIAGPASRVDERHHDQVLRDRDRRGRQRVRPARGPGHVRRGLDRSGRRP